MTKQLPKIDFVKVEALRKHMLLTVSDIAFFFNVSRETYYNWQADSYPRKKKEEFVRARIKELLYALTEKSWPTPEAIASSPKDRLNLLIKCIKGEEENEYTTLRGSFSEDNNGSDTGSN